GEEIELVVETADAVESAGDGRVLAGGGGGRQDRVVLPLVGPEIAVAVVVAQRAAVEPAEGDSQAGIAAARLVVVDRIAAAGNAVAAEVDAKALVEGNGVAGSRCGAADGDVRGRRIDPDAAVAEVERAANVGADEIALHSGDAGGPNSDACAAVARDDVAG